MRKATLAKQKADIRAGIRTGGYPKQLPNGRWGLMGYKKGKPKLLGVGRKLSCTRIRPGAPGSWISNERCSYQFNIRGRWYSCRGMGEGMAASCRRMAKAPRGVGANQYQIGGSRRRAGK
jgi:hypothetical protein